MSAELRVVPALVVASRCEDAARERRRSAEHSLDNLVRLELTQFIFDERPSMTARPPRHGFRRHDRAAPVDAAEIGTTT